MPAFIRKLLAYRLMNALAEGGDLPGETSTAEEILVNDDDFESLNGLDRGDGQGALPASANEAKGGDELNLEALLAVAAGADEHQDSEAGAKQQPVSVPHARFNEVNERRKNAETALEAAQAEILRLRESSTVKSAADMDELEEKYTAAMMDGDTKEAVKIRRQINEHIEHQAVLRIKQESMEQMSANAWGDSISNLLQEHPWLEAPESAPVLDMVTDVVEAKVAKGMTPFAALSEAKKMLVRMAPATSAFAGKDMRANNSARRGAQAAQQQAPFLHGGLGNRNSDGLVDIDNISDEAFLKLSESEKRAMRGG